MLIYRSNGRWLIWVAFGCAAAIHLGAIALAETKSHSDSAVLLPNANDVFGIDISPDETQIEPQEFSSTEPLSTTTEDETFPDERATPLPILRRKHITARPVIRSAGKGHVSAARSGSIHALVLYGPRPAYPYEARRSHVTGSGIVSVTVDPARGNVIDARMRLSTGSAILDNATVDALHRWRFKPLGVTTIDVPITYTLMGVSY